MFASSNAREFSFRKYVYIQSNPVKKDTEGATESVRINGVSVWSGSCYENKKDTFYWYKIKEDISIVKLNISNLYKAIIYRSKSTESDSKIVHVYIT